MIVLRPLEDEDVPIWYQWFNEPEITRHMNKGFSINTEEKQREFLAKLRQSRSDLQLAIVLRSGGPIVGIVGLHDIRPIHQTASVSIIIGDRAQWGKGLATEAVALITRHGFEEMNLHKLYTGIWAENTGSIRAFEKNGYVEEGRIREKYLKNGVRSDEVILGMIRPRS